MRTVTDALRSLQLHFARALGDEWEIAIARTEGAFTRPQAIISFTAGGARQPAPAGRVDTRQQVTVQAYPAAGADPHAAVLIAAATQSALEYALLEQSGPRAFPLRIPLYDFDGVGPDETVTEEQRGEHDYLRVSDVSLDAPLADPDDHRLMTVPATFFVMWSRRALLLEEPPVMGQVGFNPRPG